MRKSIIFFVSLISISCLMISTAGAEKVIVNFQDKAHPEMITSYGKVSHSYKYIAAVAADLPEQAIENLKKNDKILSIEPDVEVKALENTQTIPWGITKIGATKVPSTNGGAGVNVAIIDTGIDYSHPDLVSNYKIGGYDFVNSDTEPIDDNGHGTHCAGIIAALDNTFGVIGVAPHANLYAYKILDSSGSGSTSNLIAAIEMAIQTHNDNDPSNNIQIISMSLGAPSGTLSLKNECTKAYKSGILLVAAAGNSGSSVNYPAAYDSVIAVAATDSNNVRPSWSSQGPEVELAAPGVGISSTYLGSAYETMSGTSMACPHVSGTAALVFNAHPDWTNVQVRTKLDNTATHLGTGKIGKSNVQYGFGLVNAYAAATT